MSISSFVMLQDESLLPRPTSRLQSTERVIAATPSIALLGPTTSRDSIVHQVRSNEGVKAVLDKGGIGKMGVVSNDETRKDAAPTAELIESKQTKSKIWMYLIIGLAAYFLFFRR